MTLFPTLIDHLITLLGAAALGMALGWWMRPLFVRCCTATQCIANRRPQMVRNVWRLLSTSALIAIPYLFGMWVMDWPWYALLIAAPTTLAGVAAAAPVSSQ